MRRPPVGCELDSPRSSGALLESVLLWKSGAVDIRIDGRLAAMWMSALVRRSHSLALIYLSRPLRWWPFPHIRLDWAAPSHCDGYEGVWGCEVWSLQVKVMVWNREARPDDARWPLSASRTRSPFVHRA